VSQLTSVSCTRAGVGRQVSGVWCRVSGAARRGNPAEICNLQSPPSCQNRQELDSCFSRSAIVTVFNLKSAIWNLKSPPAHARLARCPSRGLPLRHPQLAIPNRSTPTKIRKLSILAFPARHSSPVTVFNLKSAIWNLKSPPAYARLARCPSRGLPLRHPQLAISNRSTPSKIRMRSILAFPARHLSLSLI
jgi:hypothetical protein